MPGIPFNLPKANDFVQAILFDNTRYNLQTARRLLMLLGYYDHGHRYTDNYIRFRQFNPHRNKQYSTISSGTYEGVKYIIEY
jgi:IS1 family transposase